MSELLCPICDKNVQSVNVTPDCQHTAKEIFDYARTLRKQLDESNRKLEQRIALEIDEHLKVVELQAKLDEAVDALKALLYVVEMRRNWDILSSDDFDEAYPDECGWAFGDVDENMIQKMEMAQKALAAIEKKRSD
jgi:uncharacterized Zn finger protein (UPF0148 family)